ncbi:MAG: hypothetical protein JKX76_01110 [Colwellia sp.]|nr:hypothetical protein [Colwellia sp.]
MIPVRCFTCGSVLGNKMAELEMLLFNDFVKRHNLDADTAMLEKNLIEHEVECIIQNKKLNYKTIFPRLRLTKACCKCTFMTYIDTVDLLNQYGNTTSSSTNPDNIKYEDIEVRNRADGLTIEITR